ncbi:uncharacterized protein LOC135214974 [Macrobrachium nipponense]|uniref:uncharacterized protein LOC135214974 n=1 Tax=Macrobrachium nipponense TaxID=159736 RepID=UPI0030C8107C
MKSVLALMWMTLGLTMAYTRIIQERAISDEGPASNTVSELCDAQTPCGWEIYGGLRNHVYYLKNECQCPQNTRCVRVDEDILQEAYIYQCRRVAFNDFF